MKDAKPGSAKLTHVGPTGEARMVDISGKPVTNREARARGSVKMSRAALDAIVRGNLPKGEVIGTARIAGIQAAKRTAELIPLCHPLALSFVGVEASVDADSGLITVLAEARTTGPTGVEMEALTAASVAALTVYDMVKGVQRGAEIESVVLLEKSGGRSGAWLRSAHH